MILKTGPHVAKYSLVFFLHPLKDEESVYLIALHRVMLEHVYEKKRNVTF